MKVLHTDMRCPHEHTWDWVEERWVCSECAEVSDCTCRPSDPGTYHLPKCPRSMRSHQPLHTEMHCVTVLDRADE
jgi:hypothetical protein